MALLIPVIDAEASSNPNLDVSAENSQFNNHFSGSMVVEVVIRDNNIRDTDEGKGEPDVTLNGKTLRMVQATDGNWYAYFANIDAATTADSTVGLSGKGLDFGSICTTAEGSVAIGIDLSDADGVAYPYNNCNGVFNDSNNVVRKAKFPNPLIPNNGVPDTDGLGGQIGIVEDTWPFIQLFSFDNVTIQYNPGGEAQRVDLEYDEIPNISLTLDRELYPRNSEVFIIVNDFQLNQDPTDEDSWTFSVVSPTTTFYQAFDNSGNEAASGTIGLVNLIPHLSDLGFENNGRLSLDLNSVIELKPNSNQNDKDFVDNGNPPPFNQIVTLVEKGPNSGIFESFDSGDRSTIGILSDASRGQAGSIEYNDESISILTGFSTATVDLREPDLQLGGSSTIINPGTEIPVILIDPDQNVNSGSQDDLDVFRDSALIPTLKIGNPITLKSSSDVKFYLNSNDSLNGGNNAISSIRDDKSERLFIDTSQIALNNFEKISLNLGVSASQLKSLLIDDSNQLGTNWINYDLRSFQRDFGINDFSDTTITLYFGSLSDSSPITIADSGDLSSPQGFLKLDDSDVQSIFDKGGSIFVVINFDSSDNTPPVNVGSISSSTSQPIIFDFFSFGLENNNNGINNSIYRFELEETSDNSSTFEGTFEFAVTNQLNILDDDFIESIQTIDDEIKFIVTDRMVDEEGIFISYSDLDKVGLTVTKSSKSDIQTHSGSVSTNSNSYRFGQSVTVILNDPDLNLKSDLIETYPVINDPNSPLVDTVGDNGQVLLEILIKDVRYKRCTINGIEHGGLASTGFRLIETGPATGIFEGVFNMPSQICNKGGNQLISPAGGSIELKYHDSRDSSGKSNIFSLLNNRQSVASTSSNFTPQLSVTEIKLPSRGLTSEIILSGSIDTQRRGVPLSLTLLHPDGNIQKFNAGVTSSGNYRTVFTINSDSLVGTYFIDLDYNGVRVGSVSFSVIGEKIPTWIKNNAKSWSSNALPNSQFIDGLQYLIEVGIITPSSLPKDLSNSVLPEWIKNTTKWWADNRISDEDFVQSIQYLINKSIIRI